MPFGHGTEGYHSAKQSHQNTGQDPQTPPKQTVVLEEGRCVAVHACAALIMPRKHPRNRATAYHYKSQCDKMGENEEDVFATNRVGAAAADGDDPRQGKET